MSLFKQFLWYLTNTPWKVLFELRQIVVSPIVYLYLRLLNVKIGDNAKFYGFCKVFKHTNSTIVIGSNFENRNWWDSNPLGVNHPTIITTWAENAKVLIGNNVGITGGSICAQSSIKIGNNCLIGANTTIIDTDFHPLVSKKRRYQNTNIKSKEIVIGNNVFIGMNSTILKGVTIGNNSVVGAGSIVRKNIPSDTIYNDGKMTRLNYEN